MNEPKVSIIVATYRRKEELHRALESISNLNYNNYEIVLVDDNAEIKWNYIVQGIVDDFREKYSKVLLNYIKNDSNMGSAKTRNIGIYASKGEYVCFLDDDDVYLPNRIVNQLIPMIKEGADYSITDLVLYNEKDKLVEIRNRDYIENTSPEKLFQYHLMYHMTGTDTLMFKRNYLKSVGGFGPIDLGDEFYLMSKAIHKGGKFLYVPTCDVKAYVHSAGGGLSSGNTKIIGENQLYKYKKRYFNQFDKNTKRYITTRHHLVLGLAYAKDKKWFKFIKEGIMAVVTDCKVCLLIVKNRKKV